MKYVWLLLLLCGLCTAQDLKHIHKFTHRISTKTVLDTDTCSATAVGPHVLLTASHCESPTDAITVDDSHDATVAFIVRDGKDHSLYFVSGITFKEYAVIAQKDLEIGQTVWMFGNPGRFTDLLRKGYFSGWYGDKASEMVFDMNGFSGDSGSGLFSESGVLIGVVSSRFEQGNNTFFLIGVFPLSFTKDELARAREF